MQKHSVQEVNMRKQGNGRFQAEYKTAPGLTKICFWWATVDKHGSEQSKVG